MALSSAPDNTTQVVADHAQSLSPQPPPSSPDNPIVPRLQKLRSLEPVKRPSIKVLLRQRSQGRIIHGATAREDPVQADPEASLTSRSVAPSALHRQLSLVINRTMGHDSTATEPSGGPVPSEEQLKVHRYERMMDRFQLRRVPLPRPASVTTSARNSLSHRELVQLGVGSRQSSRRNSMDNGGPMVTATADTARRNSRSNSVHAGAPSLSDAEFRSGSRRASGQQTSVHGLSVTSTVARRFERARLLIFSPTGICTRARLVALGLVFATQVVYMPFGVVYFVADHPTTITVDTTVDCALLINILVTCNTALQTSRGQLVTSRRAILRHYRQNGLALDILSVVPFELVLQVVPHGPWLRWLLRGAQIALQSTCLYRHWIVFQAAWTKEMMRADKGFFAWILYSRYSYLIRIGGIVLMIMLMAHYFACVWSALLAETSSDLLRTNDPLELHMHSIYDTLQMLQGQGLPTTTPAQDIFCSIGVLFGSIVLAVVFGHVAILVSNFSANQTSYQRKMERVFAIMGKLQLPHPIRERVHQYYEYIHAEYESLDGEIVKFAKDLSHTLELEVVLFKYMDVVMHVPHWHECSPDFQKQLVLNLSVRVYLPDDYIMRRGEVGTECYIINRGTCKQLEYATGNYEPPTLAMISEEEDASPPPESLGRRSSQVSARAPATARRSGKAAVRPKSRYSVGESARSEPDSSVRGPSDRATVLKRGQAVGEMSLIANYERSSDIRAVTYVEMCVIERDSFQQILTRYPRDREIVVNSIVEHMMRHLAAERVPCLLMQMVHEVAPDATVSTGIKMVTRAMNPRQDDPSIIFGVTGRLTDRMHDLVERGDGDCYTEQILSETRCGQALALK